MVRHFGVTHGPEIDGIVKPQPLEPVLRHHQAHIDVTLAAPVELVPLAAKAKDTRCCFHRGDAFRHHRAPDTVAGDHCDPIILCHVVHIAAVRSLSRTDSRRNPLTAYPGRERSGWAWSSGPWPRPRPGAVAIAP